MSDNEVAKTLEERGKLYGNFADVAGVAQQIKEVLRRARAENPNYFSPEMVEALDMKANKLARIVCGNPSYRDSWVDDAGYSMLIAERLKT